MTDHQVTVVLTVVAAVVVVIGGGGDGGSGGGALTVVVTMAMLLKCTGYRGPRGRAICQDRWEWTKAALRSADSHPRKLSCHPYAPPTRPRSEKAFFRDRDFVGFFIVDRSIIICWYSILLLIFGIKLTVEIAVLYATRDGSSV